MKELKGILTTTYKGYGFVKPISKKNIEDIFIPKKYIKGAIDKDLVKVKLFDKPSKKGLEGKITKIINRKIKNLVGIVIKKTKNYYLSFIPSLGKDVNVYIKTRKKLKNGDRILIQLDKDIKRHFLLGSLIKIFGNIKDPSIDIKVAIEEYSLNPYLEKKIKIDKKLDLKNRKDFTHLNCFTIDPKNAKDFDDAISITKKNNIFQLGIHIADVAYFIKPKSELDKKAYERTNSTYFPNYCIPMLPYKLANDLLSLKPGKLRLSISVIIDFDKNGKVKKYDICRSYIKSKKRFTYSEATNIKKTDPFYSDIQNMKKLALILKKIRFERGSIDFALPEVVISLDKNGAPQKATLEEYDISHQMVEEFMLKANEIVAQYLSEKNKILIYRIHEKPSKTTFEEFYSYARKLGFHLPSSPDHKDIQNIFLKAKNTPHLHRLSINFIRSMKLAFYSSENIGHYGLALEHYCHFTSPIRRYSDLVIQRLLFDKIKNIDLKKIATHCSEKEKNSFKAEFSVIYLKKLRLLEKWFKQNPNKQYVATITKIKPYHIYFEIEELLFEGNIHISNFLDDYYIYDKKTLSFSGEKTKKKIFISNKIKVKIKKIDLSLLNINWTI
ncbi:MAG: hypothetical protein AMS24_01400 [Chlamydiae bacterium SM23_39]|nr:MAG: hypothetical protein AMS24_01400 [Chlamydiae bacterium SM23_39]